MTRRHLLSAFAGAATLGRGLLTASPAPHICTEDSRDRVNVLFHGTFVFEQCNGGIRAAAPLVPGHTYGIGVWGEEVNLGSGPYTLSFEGRRLTSPPPGNPFTDPGLSYLVFSRSVVGDLKTGFCWIDLPLPDCVAGLRYASDYQLLLPGGAIGATPPSKLPTITVLRYFRHPNTLRFSPASTWQRPAGVGPKLNVHVFADPGLPSVGGDQHSSMAMDALNDLFLKPLDLTINPNANTSGYISDDLYGDVPRWEQLGLGERFAGKASSIRNCLAMAVTD